MGVLKWFREKQEVARQARVAAELERQRIAHQRRWEEDQRQQALAEERRRIRQRQENIIAILGDDKLPDISWKVALPFKFMKSEHLIYVFPNVHYLEQRVKREVIGRSAGTSVRVMKGVSVRVGQSRGTPVESDVIHDRGVGMMAVTSRHLYFNGERSFRIRFDKMVSVEQRYDGVVVTRDRVSAQPEFFIVGEQDSQFVYDLLQAIPALELPRSPEKQDPDEYHMLMLQGEDGADVFVDSE